MSDQAKQVQLIERLRSVPKNARLVVDWPPDHGLCTSCYGVGAMCHEAADELAARSTPKQGEALSDERIDHIADIVARGMPDGISGFCKSWGYRQFARALLEDCAGYYAAPPPSVEPAPPVCCQDFGNCSERCVPRANYWQAQAQLYQSTPQQVEPGWQPIETAPKNDRRMFVVQGFNVLPTPQSITGYTTDPYCVWRSDDGWFARWPHKFPPTHWVPLPTTHKEPKP